MTTSSAPIAAATERKAARAEFELGEQALAGNRLPEASARYRAAMNYRFADDGTKAKSKEQLAVVDAMMKQAGQSQKSLYDEAIADLRANNLDVGEGRNSISLIKPVSGPGSFSAALLIM